MILSENTYTLLALCAQAPGQPTQYHHLRDRAAEGIEWPNLPSLAEAHGLTPLLYTHLPAAGVAVPDAVQQQLQVRAMQHSHANQVRGRVLAEILTAFQTAGIDALVLKGAALAHLVYPRPGLRPMRDLDVLVSRSQARSAQALLAELGFDAPLPGDRLPAKHLAAATRQVEGLPVTVELHHNLYTTGSPATELEALRSDAIPFTIAGGPAYTLSYEAMLAHIYQHLRTNLLLDSLRLIWIADLVSLAERFVTEIDWPRLSPRLLKALALCHWFTPLSDELRRAAGLKPGRPPHGLGCEFQGWPRYALAAQRSKGYGRLVRDSLWPAEGWLRLYHGLSSGPALWWGRLVSHPLHILGWLAHYYRHG
ncbi:MAG TPA: nucleotidyltransferase family protein [Anaerolineae bacterium]|nr:nucleotidyltransferase family protein [Anaerolineae bacterium]